MDVAIGNADELRALAGDLDKIADGIMAHYVARVGADNRERMQTLIKGDDGQGTILSAEEVVELGLADSVMVETKAAASLAVSPRRWPTVPSRPRPSWQAGTMHR